MKIYVKTFSKPQSGPLTSIISSNIYTENVTPETLCDPNPGDGLVSTDNKLEILTNVYWQIVKQYLNKKRLVCRGLHRQKELWGYLLCHDGCQGQGCCSESDVVGPIIETVPNLNFYQV